VRALVVLEDGSVFEGESFGAPGTAVGEIVFNTGMTGYQEILTDPSYSSQIVTMTYPLIGNYGVNVKDVQSKKIQSCGFVVKEACAYPSNFTSEQSLGEYCTENGIVGVSGVDTRAITRRIRIHGAMKAVVHAGDDDADTLVDKAKAWEGLLGRDIVQDVTCERSYVWDRQQAGPATGDTFNVVAFDFGIKYDILRILSRLGCNVTVVPAKTSADEVKQMDPDGIFLSNGPGDPAPVTYAIETIRSLIGYKPIFGICLGHQLLSLAYGAATYKLKFGHHGSNHPVRHMQSGSIGITAQNHGFCVDMDTLKDRDVRMTHLNLNDNTCEGMEDPGNKCFSVQYHPEAAPGPHDSGYLFDTFVALMQEHTGKKTPTSDNSVYNAL
jgi:carbamoyl-phosphate synthase small subunit